MSLHIGILGGGRMGKDVFDMFSRNGYAVTLYVRRPEAAAELEEALLGALRRRASKPGARGEAALAHLNRLKITTQLDDLATCDLINENITEEVALKQPLLRALEERVRPDCIVTSDSSFNTPDVIFEQATRPARCLNLHFFYPTMLTSFVEVIPAAFTAPEVTEKVIEIVKSLKVRPILCRSVPGFLVNRMIPAFYLEGVLMLEEGYFSAAEIDALAKSQLLSMGAGPLEASDQIGIDLVGKENKEYKDLWREGWIHPPLLKLLVEAGRLGPKSGKGIYAYPEGRPVDESAQLPRTERYQSVAPYEKDELVDRLYFNVVVEAFRQLDLGVGSEEDIDHTLKEVLGFKQGPIASARQKGLANVKTRLEALAARYGARFTPRGSLAG